MVTLEQLRAARERIARGWTQNAFARNGDGDVVHSKNPNAVCWCVVGALLASGADEDDTHYILRRSVKRSPDFWNDDPERTQADAIALYDRLLAAAEAAP